MNYNNQGYLSSISAGGATRYTITEMNARQQLTAATYGSSLNATYGFDSYGYLTSTQTGSVQDWRYSFDATTGNLSSRQNYLRSKSESFEYDDLDRLLSVTGPQNLTMTHVDNGNISTKSDIGTSEFEYGSSAGPYALTGVESSTSVIPTFDQDVTYNSFQKVSTVTENDTTATFIYNSDNERAKMVVTDGGNTILTRWYVSGSYMKETVGSTTTEYTYLGGDAYTAPVVAVTSGGTTNYYYLLRDHLGNITHKVNTSNTVVAEYSFDAWGRRRNPSDWSYNLNNEPELVAGRGFTGHENLQWFNLINMNGRLYDPLVGRFLSVDNTVQSPYYTQSYNRYSYCWNNPLKYADPSGYKLFNYEMSPGYFIPECYPASSGSGGGGVYALMTGASVSGYDFGRSAGDAYWDMIGAVNGLGKSEYGGTWSRESGTTYFENDLEAFAAGSDHNNRFDSWGYTSGKSFQAAYATFMGAKIQEAALRALASYSNRIQSLSEQYSNSLLAFTGDKGLNISLTGKSKITAGAQLGGDFFGLGGQGGIFLNLYSITLFGHEDSKIFYPGSQYGYSQMNQGFSAGYFIGGSVNHTFDGSFGDYGGFKNNRYSFDLSISPERRGIFGIYYDSGSRSINIGISFKGALGIGIEGTYHIKIDW